MQYNKLQYFISQPRLGRFLAACGYSRKKAQKLYRINLRVAQAFYPILNLFEIFLRNALNNEMSIHFSDPDWIINEKYGFMNDAGLTGTRFFLKTSVQKAENTVLRRGNSVTPDKIVAEQTLGFWTSLFDVHHYRLLRGALIHAFPNKPAFINRSLLSQKLILIRDFRNRIYHNEPICFIDNRIDFTHVRHVRNEIYALLTWMDSELPAYVNYFDAIDAKIYRAERI